MPVEHTPKTYHISDFSDLVGQELGVSDWIVISQDMISAFSHLTGDLQWIHIDSERAFHESPFKTTIANGFLTLSTLPRMATQAITMDGVRLGLNYGLNRVRFVAPVPCGGRIRGRFTLASVTSFADGVDLVWLCTIEIEGGEKPACVAEWLARLHSA